MIRHATCVGFCLAIVLSAGVCFGQNNPEADVNAPLHYIKNGQAYNPALLVADVWHPGWQGWNNRYTSAQNRIANANVTSSFPYTDPDNDEVTAAMVNAYWDNYYAGYDRISGTTPARNCWGYAMPHSFWVNDDAVILQDEYDASNGMDADVIALTGHMIKIEDLHDLGCDEIRVVKTSEKNRDSGVYRLDSLGPMYQGTLSNGYARQ